MKKIRILIPCIALLFSAVSCDEFLGENKNPNQAITATPELVLPNALTSTSFVVRQYNFAAFPIMGYYVNAGGFGGFGSVITYNYTTNDHQIAFQNTYDDMMNYQYILNETAGKPEYAYFNAVAKIMKAHDFQLLVDFYNDVPYFDALKGAANLTPGYDTGEEIYQDMIGKLDEAITEIEDATGAVPLGNADVIFDGDMLKWQQFANTLKLRMLVRISEVASLNTFVTTEFAAFDQGLGVITDDVLINPGYLPTEGKQSPMWGAYHSNAAGAQPAFGRQWIPSTYVMTFYTGSKIQDDFRGPKTYKNFPTTPNGQLGNLDDSQPIAITNYIAWYVGTGVGSSAENTTGLFKGRTAGLPILLLAEAQFLLAEARMKGNLTGSDEDAYEAGVEASFRYLYKDINNAVVGNPAADAATYFTDNAGNPLVDYTAAGTDEEKLEAIITQKYIANNMVSGYESWSEFRRTGYPKIANSSTDPNLTFASKVSNSTRPDRLPIRVLYPSSEYQLNDKNVPNDINQFSDKIFWQP